MKPWSKRRRVKVKRIEEIEAPDYEQISPLLPEDRFQAICEEVAQRYNWLVYHETDSRKSPKGLPDLIMLSPVQEDGSIILAMIELKSKDGKPSAEQEAWLMRLAGVSTLVTGWVRPDGWPKILSLLFDPTEGVPDE